MSKKEKANWKDLPKEQITDEEKEKIQQEQLRQGMEVQKRVDARIGQMVRENEILLYQLEQARMKGVEPRGNEQSNGRITETPTKETTDVQHNKQ